MSICDLNKKKSLDASYIKFITNLSQASVDYLVPLLPYFSHVNPKSEIYLERKISNSEVR